MLWQLRAVMGRRGHYAVNARAGARGGQFAFRLRCTDCAFIFEFTGAFGGALERIEQSLYHFSAARGGPCSRRTQTADVGFTTEGPAFSLAARRAASMGFLLLDVARRTATILSPKRAQHVRDEDWSRILSGLDLIKRELEMLGFTVSIEGRE